MHLVTGRGRTGRLATGCYSRCLVIPNGKEGAGRADGKIGLPLRLGRVGVAVQLEWGTEGDAAIVRADVVDVAGIAAVFSGIDVANYVVESGRLTPAHVCPVSGAVVHGAEVARISTARAHEGGAGVGVVPCVTAIGGAVDLVGSVGAAAGTAAVAAVFVHRGDVHVSRDQVAGDLHVADEGRGDLSFVSPCN